jgi:hypothetical protein
MLFSALNKSVIPECSYRESRKSSDWTPDPFDVAQGRGEHSRTTMKTFGGDNVGINFHGYFLSPRQLAAGRFIAAYSLAVLLSVACQALSAHAASAPSKIVIAHAGMNARTVVLWTAQEQKFFAKYAPTRKLFLSARRRFSSPA